MESTVSNVNPRPMNPIWRFPKNYAYLLGVSIIKVVVFGVLYYTGGSSI